jgi:hypothetical protein
LFSVSVLQGVASVTGPEEPLPSLSPDLTFDDPSEGRVAKSLSSSLQATKASVRQTIAAVNTFPCSNLVNKFFIFPPIFFEI